jgi:hypothetical protein
MYAFTSETENYFPRREAAEAYYVPLLSFILASFEANTMEDSLSKRERKERGEGSMCLSVGFSPEAGTIMV